MVLQKYDSNSDGLLQVLEILKNYEYCDEDGDRDGLSQVLDILEMYK